MILMQTPWSAVSINEDVNAILDRARHTLVDDGPMLALLPHADGHERDAVPQADLANTLGELGRRHNLYVGGSAYVIADGESKPRTVAYLAGPDGSLLARAVKFMPDIVEGFTDTQSNFRKKGDFQVAATPLGQVGLLCGEDVLCPHIVRALVMSGAEIIMNPCRERTDSLFEIRQKARLARAYENICYLASASPTTVTLGMTAEKLPPATALCEWWGTKTEAQADESLVTATVDLTTLRERRQQAMGNYPAIVRMNLYAEGYKKEASTSTSSPGTRDEWLNEGLRRISAQAKISSSDKQTEDYFDVLLAQTVTHQSTHPDQLIEFRERNLSNALRVTRGFAANASLRLVVFPEFFLTGAVSPLGSRSGHIAHKIGISFPGPEADRISEFAQANKTYVAGGVFEYDPEWPQRFFNSAFIFDDAGNLIHLYRKIHCADVFGRLPDTTPGSIYDQYIDKYGYDHLFPVADTPLGKLATVICFDMNFPETHRAMVKRGAEVIIHPTSEPHNIRRRGWDIARHVRAFENTAYVLTCGHGGEYRGYDAVPHGTMNRGFSKVVNFDGSLQAVVEGPGATPLVGALDMGALRRARENLKANLGAWDDPVVYQNQYKAELGLPNNLWADDPLGNPYEDFVQLNKVIDLYNRNGIFVPPGSEFTHEPSKPAD